MPRATKPEARLPAWGYAVVLAGAVVTYFVVGQLLHAPNFLNDLEAYLLSSRTPESIDAERVAPLVLLLIPAVLGGFGTRALVRRLLEGMKRQESRRSMAIAIGGMLASVLVLVLLALFSAGKGRR
jgi:amino acid permease